MAKTEASELRCGQYIVYPHSHAARGYVVLDSIIRKARGRIWRSPDGRLRFIPEPDTRWLPEQLADIQDALATIAEREGKG